MIIYFHLFIFISIIKNPYIKYSVNNAGLYEEFKQ